MKHPQIKTLALTSLIILMSILFSSCSLFDEPGSRSTEVKKSNKEVIYSKNSNTKWEQTELLGKPSEVAHCYNQKQDLYNVRYSYSYYGYDDDTNHHVSIDNLSKKDKLHITGIVSNLPNMPLKDLNQPGLFQATLYPGQFLSRLPFKNEPNGIYYGSDIYIHIIDYAVE